MPLSELETYERPEQISPQNVCFWFEKEQRLSGSQKAKAKKFLENDCIKEESDEEFSCLPIKDYNSTTHRITHSPLTNKWTCTCQFNRDMGGECSHIIACRLFLFIKNWNRR